MSDQTGGRGNAAPALLDRYLARYAGRTRENLCGYLRRWVAWCETRGVDWPTATADDALTWAAELRDAGRSTRTVATLLSALRGLYRWLWVTGQRPDDASQQIPLPPRERSADRVWLASSTPPGPPIRSQAAPYIYGASQGYGSGRRCA